MVVGGFVTFKGGKYKGKHLKLVKVMPLMCKVKLDRSQEEVNVYQTNVESADVSRGGATNAVVNEIQQHLDDTQQMKDELHQM